MKHLRHMRIALPAFFLIAFFQNCGKAPSSSQTEFIDSRAERVISGVHSYDKISFAYQDVIEGNIFYSAQLDSPKIPRLEVDVPAATAVLKNGATIIKSCLLAPILAEELSRLTSDIYFCKQPPQSEPYVCPAVIIQPDLEIANAEENVRLDGGGLCSQAHLLCEGREQKLRALLNQAVSACQNQ